MPQPSYPHGAPVAARRPGRHNAWLIVLAVVLALAIVVCSGVIAYGWANRENNSGGYDSGHGTSGSAGTRGTTAGAVRAGVIDIPCNLYRLQKFEKVKDKLRDSDFQVVRRDVPGPGQGRVVDVAPCQAPRGAAVTVKVATGKVRHD